MWCCFNPNNMVCLVFAEMNFSVCISSTFYLVCFLVGINPINTVLVVKFKSNFVCCNVFTKLLIKLGATFRFENFTTLFIKLIIGSHVLFIIAIRIPCFFTTHIAAPNFIFLISHPSN